MERNADLVARLGQVYDIFNTGDVAIAEDLVSHEEGILGVGTDPREWWLDDALFEAFNAQAPEMHAAGLRFESGDLQAFSEGSVGWFADQPTLKMPDGNGVPMRLTGVCHQEDGAWKMVQFHLSIGMMNEEAIGEELTI